MHKTHKCTVSNWFDKILISSLRYLISGTQLVFPLSYFTRWSYLFRYIYYSDYSCILIYLFCLIPVAYILTVICNFHILINCCFGTGYSSALVGGIYSLYGLLLLGTFRVNLAMYQEVKVMLGRLYSTSNQASWLVSESSRSVLWYFVIIVIYAIYPFGVLNILLLYL